MPRIHSLFSFLAVLCLGTAQLSAQQQYRVVDLSTPGTSLYLRGSGDGQQVGLGVYPGQPIGSSNRAILWSGSADTMVDLTPSGYSYGFATGAENGVQVGTVASNFTAVPKDTTFAPYRASLWHGTSAGWMDLNPAGYYQSWGNCIAGGQQGGYGKPTSAEASHALLWSGTAASVVDLTPYPGIATVVNGCAPGVQVGNAGDRAAMWHGTAASFVNLHPDFYAYSNALAVSQEQTVGWGNHSHAVLWTGTDNFNVIDLHPMQGVFNISIAESTSGAQQVGWAQSLSGATHAFLWNGSAASAVDLHQFLPGYSYSQAWSIEPNGTIAGTAIAGDGTEHSVLWIPTTPVISAAASLDTDDLVGGNLAHLTVTLSSPAPAGGAEVALRGNAMFQLPASVVIPEGETMLMLPVNTDAVNVPLHLLITATYGGIDRMASLLVEPEVLLTGFTMSDYEPQPGAVVTGTVTLKRPAPAAGATVVLTSSDPLVTMPASVDVAPGASSATFSINVSSGIPTSRSVSFTAQAGAITLDSGMFVLVPDVVKVTRVQYTTSKKDLAVEATTTDTFAQLSVFDGKGNLLGALIMSRGKGKGDFILPANPGTIVLQSTSLGSASATVPNK
jgi:hypothetical protein